MESQKSSSLLSNVSKENINHSFLAICLIIVWLLPACGGGSSTGPEDTDEEQKVATVTGTVYGPSTENTSASEEIGSENNEDDSDLKSKISGIQKHSKSAEQQIEIQSKNINGEATVADAKVEFYDLQDYTENPNSAQLLVTTATDSDGKYSVSDLPTGIDVLILVDIEPRLSSVVFDVDEQSSADITSSTTLASEHWGTRLMDGSMFGSSDFQNTVEIADELLGEKDSDDLAATLDELVPENFGDGFPDDLSADAQIIVNALEGIGLEACQDLELLSSAGKPTDEIDVRGLKDDFGDEPLGWVYNADVENQDEDIRHLAYVERTAGEEAFLVVPLHPAAPMEGGTAEIVFSDEDESMNCPGIEFTVEPLQAAPGVFEAMVDSMEMLYEREAENFGENPDDLRTADVSQFDERPYIALIAAGLQMIGGPNYPNNLRARLAGDAPMFEERALNEKGLELFNALAVETGYASLDPAPRTPKAIPSSTNSIPAVSECMVEPRNISTPAELDCWMQVQQTYGDIQEGQVARRDVALEIISLIGEVEIPFLDDDSDFGNLQELASTLEAPLQWSQMMADGLDSMMPSDLLGLTLEVDRTDYNEDEDEEASWTSELVATGSDWEADVLLTLDVATAGGAGKGAKMLSKKAKHSKKVQDFVENTADDIFSEMQDNDVGVIEIDQLIYGPVEVDPNRDDEEEYFSWGFNTEESETGEDPFVLLDDESRYKPAAVGESELVIETRDGVFQDIPAFNNEFLSVEKIDVNIHQNGPLGPSPNIFRVGPDDDYTVDLWAEVDNAEDKTVEWFLELEEGPHVASISASGAEDRSAVFDASAIQSYDETRSVYRIEAESVTEEGLREGLDPTRSDIARIIVSDEDYELRVSQTGCVTKDEPHQFLAEVGGEEIAFSDLTWSISGPGTLQSDGTFLASQTGSVTINFEYDVPDREETLTDQVTFEIEESCGILTVNSNHFEYTSKCVGALYVVDEVSTSQLETTVRAPFKVELSVVNFDITEGGNWTRNQDFIYQDGFGWYVTVYDSNGDEWSPNLMNNNYLPMTIERQEVEINDEIVGTFNGTFELSMVNQTVYEETDERIVTNVEGEFSDVRYGKYGCGHMANLD